MLHHLLPVEGWTERVEVLLFGEAGDALLEVVLEGPERRGSALVAGGHVGARELVQLVEQRAGVAHVATHRRVAPPLSVPVEAQVHLDERADVVDHGVRVAELSQPLLGHAGADHLVVVELHTLGRDLAGGGLADVVQERREPQHLVALAPFDHGVGVSQHVLVLMHRVLFELERGELGQERVGEAGRHEQREPFARMVADEQLRELLADALGRDDLQPVAHRLDRGDDPGRRLDVELGDESRGAEHAQRVVAERDLGLERRVEHARCEVAHPSVRIDERPVGKLHGHRVDREVAPRQVGLDVVAERHRGLAVLVGVDLLAERGDLEAVARPSVAPTVPNCTPTR